MGREIRRVALDFNWPLNKVWDGFLNPHYRECPEKCGGGYSVAYRQIAEHLNRLVWMRSPDANTAKVITFLAGREPHGHMGYDSCAAYSAVLKLGEVAGLTGEWHTCPTCKGSGLDPAIKDAYENWEATNPPSGEGWQIWETVSEGSPISPVFSTAEGLIEHLVTIGDGWGHPVSRKAAEAFVNGPGWVPSMVMTNGVMLAGVESAGLLKP